MRFHEWALLSQPIGACHLSPIPQPFPFSFPIRAMGNHGDRVPRPRPPVPVTYPPPVPAAAHPQLSTAQIPPPTPFLSDWIPADAWVLDAAVVHGRVH